MSTAAESTNAAPGAMLMEPNELKRLLDAGQAVLIDVREPDEHARERIAGARLMPLSNFDPSEVPVGVGTKIVLHCRSGKRSADAAARLSRAGRSGFFDLQGGIEAWKAAGLPVQRSGGTTISLMRQVQLVVGASVLGASILAWVVSPLFLILTGFFGAGLLFAGATGTCGLAAALSVMPWNRAACGGKAATCCEAGSCGRGGN